MANRSKSKTKPPLRVPLQVPLRVPLRVPLQVPLTAEVPAPLQASLQAPPPAAITAVHQALFPAPLPHLKGFLTVLSRQQNLKYPHKHLILRVLRTKYQIFNPFRVQFLTPTRQMIGKKGR